LKIPLSLTIWTRSTRAQCSEIASPPSDARHLENNSNKEKSTRVQCARFTIEMLTRTLLLILSVSVATPTSISSSTPTPTSVQASNRSPISSTLVPVSPPLSQFTLSILSSNTTPSSSYDPYALGDCGAKGGQCVSTTNFYWVAANLTANSSCWEVLIAATIPICIRPRSLFGQLWNSSYASLEQLVKLEVERNTFYLTPVLGSASTDCVSALTRYSCYNYYRYCDSNGNEMPFCQSLCHNINTACGTENCCNDGSDFCKKPTRLGEPVWSSTDSTGDCTGGGSALSPLVMFLILLM